MKVVGYASLRSGAWTARERLNTKVGYGVLAKQAGLLLLSSKNQEKKKVTYLGACSLATPGLGLFNLNSIKAIGHIFSHH